MYLSVNSYLSMDSKGFAGGDRNRKVLMFATINVAGSWHAQKGHPGSQKKHRATPQTGYLFIAT
jgi:hypothetical protein